MLVPTADPRTTIDLAETMLTVAPFVGVDLDRLELLRRRFEQHAAMLDAAEPDRRRELQRRYRGSCSPTSTSWRVRTNC